MASDPVTRDRFEREARAVAALNHPNICTLHDIGSQDGVDFLVMEYLDGETLAARLERGPIPLPQALSYAIQIASALDRVHRAGIVHRDLKPGNVMLTKAGAKLLDFGLAKSTTPVRFPDAESTRCSEITSTGVIVGTVQYMAPEQLEGKPADTRSDIFSFGALLYEIVVGSKAFAGINQTDVFTAIREGEPPPSARLPPALNRIVQTCLAKEPYRPMADSPRFAASARMDFRRRIRRLGSATPQTVANCRMGRFQRGYHGNLSAGPRRLHVCLP